MTTTLLKQIQNAIEYGIVVLAEWPSGIAPIYRAKDIRVRARCAEVFHCGDWSKVSALKIERHGYLWVNTNSALDYICRELATAANPFPLDPTAHFEEQEEIPDAPISPYHERDTENDEYPEVAESDAKREETMRRFRS